MLYEVLRLLFTMAIHIPRFFWSALGFSRLMQWRQMHRLHDRAEAMGFSKRDFGKKWDKAELSGTFSGIKVKVRIQFSGSSHTGTFVAAALKGNPRRLMLESGLYNYFLSHTYKGSYYPRFSTGHKGFDTTFMVRFADKKTAEALTKSTDLLDALTRFYRTWVLSTHSFSIENKAEKTKITIRFTYGYPFHPYIRPELLREVVNEITGIASLWNQTFGSNLSDAEKRLAGLLFHFAEKGNAKKVAELLQQGASVDFTNRNHETALHLGAESRNIEVVHLLLEAGADPNARDHSGSTPLFRIISCPTDPKLLELLLDHGADVNIVNDMGETILFMPARWNDVPIVQILVNHNIDVTPVNQCGETALSVTKHGTESRRIIGEAGGGEQ